uniref:SEC24-like protein C, COPII coat complex component n=1 Tax=Molossus molossus TaxID=27622 RepID=A0A7J8DR05_MOLMO|nr:SEC24-like protein C, COPII coat complex component [Molossus molossus]
MNVNQSAPPVPPFGQPQPVYPGYHQSSYGGQPGSTAPPTPYGTYNGPVQGYQQTPPPGVSRVPHSSGAPPTSTAQVSCGQATYGQFGQGDVQNGPSSTVQMQRYVLGST